MNRLENTWQALLRRREQELDAATLAQIGAARRKALGAVRASWWQLHASALGGAALATVLAVAVLLPAGTGWLNHPGNMSMTEDATFYENLDFYLWLAESEVDTHD